MASIPALLFGSVLLFAIVHSNGTWCVCKDGPDAVLQKSLDYACGHGADCNPIKASGVCYNPNSMKAHCSYAVNSYYQKMNQLGGTCDFSSTAYITTTDPSITGCSFPASASSAGSTSTSPTSTTPTGTTPVGTTTPVSGTTPTTSSPYTTSPTGVTPSAGILGGVGTGTGIGIAPTGMDDSKAGMTRLDITSIVALCSVVAGLLLHLLN